MTGIPSIFEDGDHCRRPSGLNAASQTDDEVGTEDSDTAHLCTERPDKKNITLKPWLNVLTLLWIERRTHGTFVLTLFNVGQNVQFDSKQNRFMVILNEGDFTISTNLSFREPVT